MSSTLTDTSLPSLTALNLNPSVGSPVSTTTSLPLSIAIISTPSHWFECEPVQYYVVLAVLLGVLNMVRDSYSRNLSYVCSQGLSILCCGAILNWMCASMPTVIWAVIACQVLSLICGCISWLIYGSNTQPPPVTTVILTRDPRDIPRQP